MFRTLTNCLLQFSLFVFLQTNHSSFGQKAFPIEESAKKLTAKTDSLNLSFWNFPVKLGAEKSNNEIWKDIGSGSNGKISFLLKKYNEAKPLLEYDHCYHIFDNAGYSLQRIVGIHLLQGKKDGTLGQSNETLGLIKQKIEATPSYSGD